MTTFFPAISSQTRSSPFSARAARARESATACHHGGGDALKYVGPLCVELEALDLRAGKDRLDRVAAQLLLEGEVGDFDPSASLQYRRQILCASLRGLGEF
ncbi:unnamed protein product [Prorocentrum cordatum]|uniref:Uncharacterized protein n=1 Tax=Prorocentrum cordatum TaxID=2364126 RepID=A0ABN9PJ40_9DINO|nr:unnamed protein product [Polarella glacialis]